MLGCWEVLGCWEDASLEVGASLEVVGASSLLAGAWDELSAAPCTVSDVAQLSTSQVEPCGAAAVFSDTSPVTSSFTVTWNDVVAYWPGATSDPGVQLNVPASASTLMPAAANSSADEAIAACSNRPEMSSTTVTGWASAPEVALLTTCRT